MYRTIISSILSEFGDTNAMVFHDRQISYTELIRLIDGNKIFLSKNSIEPGQVVSLDAIYSPRTCALLIALIENGNIIVPLPAAPEEKRTGLLHVAQVEREILADGRVVAHNCRADHPYYQQLRAGALPGLVLFSSGTTGGCKAPVLNFAKLITHCDRSTLRPRRALAFLSLDHIGGINTLISTLVHGGCVITVAERSPKSVYQAVALHRVDTLPTTPTFLTMSLIAGEFARHDLRSLRLITYGTEPMPLQTLRKLNNILPAVRFKQTYGLSEVGILPTVSKDNHSLWMKLGSHGFAHKIIDGTLWVRSEMAMLGYLNASAAFDEDGYFNTQDVVEVDGDYIKVLGRKSELINVGGEKVYPGEVENILLEMDHVAEATVTGKPSPVTGMVVRAVLRLTEPEPLSALQQRVRAYCKTRLQAFKIPVIIELTDQPMYSDRLKKTRVG
jgi:acyl-CoA synthetase (AMP-forming)/AMP-acid ligase II